MAEIRECFRSFEEWHDWSLKKSDLNDCRRSVVNDIRMHGFTEPFSDIKRFPFQIRIDANNLGESVSCAELNSRKRALLVQIDLELRARGLRARRDLKILGTEGLTRLALILRGIFSFYLGSEYMPTQSEQQANFPIPHVDLRAMDFEDDSFDMFTSGDVLEHVPNLDRAIEEIVRSLKPGGLIVSAFPFSPQRMQTVVRASLQDDGTILHHLPPEQQSNPGGPPAGPLVFQRPGWDILEKLRDCGCSDAYFATVLSSCFGVVSNLLPGPYVLVAQKKGASGKIANSPARVDCRMQLPDKLCTLIALPRSGTTVFTSMFAVHSRVEASYEPWNSKVLDTGHPEDSTISSLANKEKLSPLAGKILFVKETAVRPEYITALNSLYDSTPYPVERFAIMLLRDPHHTLLSELDRRNEWWGENLDLSADIVRRWSGHRGLSLRTMIEQIKARDGIIVCLEDFAERPSDILIELSQRIGFAPEREQLEYEKHLHKSRVRGDLNVSKQPEKIDINKVLGRQDRVDELQALIDQSGTANWFAAFAAFHGAVRQLGGIAIMKQVPEEAISAIMEAQIHH